MQLKLLPIFYMGITQFIRRRVEDLSFFDCLIPFGFLLIEFHCTFSISYRILANYVYYYCILIRIVQDVGTSFFFVPTLLLSILTPFFLPSLSVSLSYFIIAIPIRECMFGKIRVHKFSISYSHTEWYFIFFRQCNYKCTMCIRSEKTRNNCALVNLCL